MIWGGLPATLIKAAEQERIVILISEEIVEEISRILSHDRLREIYAEAGVSHETLIGSVLRIGKIVEVRTRLSMIREDLSDNKILECAVDGRADYIVSGDDHLLRLGSCKRTEIVSVREFSELLNH